MNLPRFFYVFFPSGRANHALFLPSTAGIALLPHHNEFAWLLLWVFPFRIATRALVPSSRVLRLRVPSRSSCMEILFYVFLFWVGKVPERLRIRLHGSMTTVFLLMAMIPDLKATSPGKELAQNSHQWSGIAILTAAAAIGSLFQFFVSILFVFRMNRAPKRQRTQLRGFHSDWVPADDDDISDFVHAREGSITRKGNRARLSLLRREPQRALGTDTWREATFWATPDDTEFALDPSGDLFDQALEANVMDESPSVTSASSKNKEKKKKKNSRTSVRPHVIWKEQYRQIYLDEMLRWSGRGDFRTTEHCSDCVARSAPSLGRPEYRCKECFVPDLTCSSCCIKRHRQHPFHRIQRWDGDKFLNVSLKSLGFKLQLNHTGSFCSNPIPAHQNMLILHTNGIHDVAISYCGCSRAQPHNVQLLRRRLYPASHITIRTCVSFQLLDLLHKLALTTKASTYDFYRALEKLTNNTGMDVPKSRYKPLFRTIMQWRHLKMLKWGGRANDASGVDGTKTGELAVRCPSCPHPGINLPEDWKAAPGNMRFLFMMIICMDANFRLKNQIVSNYSQDPGLGIGWAYLVPRQPYESYVLSRASDDDISTCVGFQALAKANTKFSVGLRYTGVGAVVCGRSEMILPSGVGNLQKGERYANMDFIFGSALQYVLVLMVLISYDVACQWFANIFVRINGHWPDSIKPHSNMTLVPAIPKLHEPMHQQKDHQVFSLNFVKGVGLSDCECPERVWAPHNALSNSTKTQGPGSRQDVLDDHFGFWNWLKYIGQGTTLLRRYKAAVAQRNLQQEGHRGLTSTIDTDLVEKWEQMCEEWEADSFPKKATNPYYLEDAYMSEAQVKKELAEEEEQRLAAGGVVLHETSASAFIQMGLDLEEAQRRLKRLDATLASKIKTTLTNDRSITEERNNFRVRRRAWEKLVPIYMPGLLHYQTVTARTSTPSQKTGNGANIPEGLAETERPLEKPEDDIIWLPSHLPAQIRKQVCIEDLPEIEERLRDAQCTDSLEKLRRILRVKSRMIYFKNKNIRGQRDGTRSRSVIDRIHLKARNAADKYRACRAAKLLLAGPGKWEETFRVLNNDDIRSYQDPDHLRPRTARPGTLEDGVSAVLESEENEEFELFNEVRTRRDGTGQTRRTLSWIWLTTPSNDRGDKDDILRVEWAKSRARAARATEEVMLLKEEMRRVIAFLAWKARWWEDRQQSRSGLHGEHAEAIRAFALNQSALQNRLASHFCKLWEAPLEDAEEDETVSTTGMDNDSIQASRTGKKGDNGEKDGTNHGMSDTDTDEDDEEDDGLEDEQDSDRENIIFEEDEDE